MGPTVTSFNSKLLNDSHALADLLQDGEGLIQLFARVGSSHDGADTSLAFGDGWEGDAGSEHTVGEKLARELHRRLAVTDDDGRDGRLAGGCVLAADVEAQQAELLLEELSVLPELFHPLRFVLQDVEGGDAGSGNGRWMRRRKEERTAAVIEEVDQVASSANVSAQRTDGLGERAHLDVDATVLVEVIDGAATLAAQDARRVRVVDHHNGAVFFGDVAEAG